MGGGFSLGNFGGQLTADELQRALAAAGSRPDAVDFGESALPATVPTPPVDALAPTEPPAASEMPAAEPPPDMSVQRARGGPQRAIREYQDANLADANRMIELAGQGGGKDNPLDARTYDEMASVRGRQAEQSRANIADAKSRVSERRDHERRYQEEADRLYEDMRAHAQPPPQSTVSKVLGIVGAVAGMGGNKGVANGLGMLSGMLGADQERWAQEQAANSQLYKAALMSVGSDREGMSSDLDVAERMAVLEAHEIDASLEQVKAMGLSRNATRNAEDLQLAFRSKVRDGLAAMEAQKAAAAAQSRSAQAEDPLWRMPLDALKQLNAGGGLSEMGQKVLAQRIANDQKDRGGEADISKKLGESGGDGLQRGVGGAAAIDGLRLTKSPSGVTAKDYEQAKEIKDGFATMRTAMDAMIKSQGDLSIQSKRDYDNNFAFVVGSLNSLANAGVLNPGELAAWKERLPKHKIDNLTSARASAALVDEEKQLEDMRDQFRGLAEEKLRSRGYEFDLGGTRGAGAAVQRPTGDPRVRAGHTRPSASSQGIRRDERGGFSLPDVAEMSPDEMREKIDEADIPDEFLVRR